MISFSLILGLAILLVLAVRMTYLVKRNNRQWQRQTRTQTRQPKTRRTQ